MYPNKKFLLDFFNKSTIFIIGTFHISYVYFVKIGPSFYFKTYQRIL